MDGVRSRPAGPPLAVALTALAIAAVLVALDLLLQVGTGVLAATPLASTLFLVAMAGLVAAGAVVTLRARERGLGLLLAAVAATGTAWDLLGALPGDDPAAWIRTVEYWLYAALFAHLLLRWPDHRVHGAVPRALLGCLYVLPAILSLGWQLTWDPRWFDPPAPDRWWPRLLALRDLSASIFDAQQLVFLALVVALLVVITVRVVRADRARRRALLPVTVAAALLGASVALEVLVSLGATVPVDLGLLQNLAVLAVPVAVLVRPPVPIDDERGRRSRTPLEQVRARYAGLIGFVAAGAVIAAIAVTLSVRSLDLDAAPAAPAPGPPVPAAGVEPQP